MDTNSLKQLPGPAQLVSDHLRALWYDLNGDWDKAHSIVQQMDDPTAMWIHAYLHRKEPDISNAKYWYRRAGKPYPEDQSYQDEVENILETLG